MTETETSLIKPTLIILPTYNERENIERIVNQLTALHKEIEVLVVDDDSPDGTGAASDALAAADTRVHVLHRTQRRGRGYAGLDGYRWALERANYEWIGEMDADGSHGPEYLLSVLAAMPEADMVICSRLVPGGGERGRPFPRRLMTIIANTYIRRALGVSVRDNTSGFRVMRREALAAIPLDRVSCAGPAILQEIIFLFARAGFRIRETPYTFVERAAGRSKLSFRKLLQSLRDVRGIPRRLGG